MAKKKSKYLLDPKHPLRTLVYIFIALGFLVGGYFTLKATQTSTESRSKAAETEIVVDSWEFNGSLTEGWVKTNLNTGNIKNGYMYTVVVSEGKNSVLQQNVVKPVDKPEQVKEYGLQNLKIRLQISDPASKIPAQSSGKPFTAEVRAMLNGKNIWESPRIFTGTIDAKYHEYSLRLIDLPAIDITKLQITFPALPQKTQVSIDWIRLVTSSEPAPPPFASDIDPQTLEMYDFTIEPTVTTLTPSEQGYLNGGSVIFKLWGDRIKQYKTMYGFLQRQPYHNGDKQITFQYQGEGYPRFLSQPAKIFYNDCIDLHTSGSPTIDNYLATFCFKIGGATSGENKIFYNSDGRLYFTYKYIGSKATTLLFITTAFNKYNNLPPYNGVNGRGTRVNYLTVDSNASNLSDFTNLNYTIQGIAGGLDNQAYRNLCMIAPGLPKKYFKQVSSRPKPEGGNNFELNTIVGACAFEYKPTYLSVFYLSLFQDDSTRY